jgi:aminoglycoside 6'-N-acetyltransferase
VNSSFERGGYGFRRMEVADLEMVRAWLAEPHLREFWGEPETQYDVMAEGLGLDWVNPVIVTHDGRPFAYLQCYDLHSEDYAPYPDQPPGARGMDTFIGVPAMLGIGHAGRYLRAYTDHRLETGTPRLVIDPNEANARAIRAYTAAGFTVERLHVDEEGRFLIMTRDAARISP